MSEVTAPCSLRSGCLPCDTSRLWRVARPEAAGRTAPAAGPARWAGQCAEGRGGAWRVRPEGGARRSCERRALRGVRSALSVPRQRAGPTGGRRSHSNWREPHPNPCRILRVRSGERNTPEGDWRRGSALPSHGRGHWFDPSIAHGRIHGIRSCGRSSVGRASPCQGEGRRFESGRPLRERRIRRSSGAPFPLVWHIPVGWPSG